MNLSHFTHRIEVLEDITNGVPSLGFSFCQGNTEHACGDGVILPLPIWWGFKGPNLDASVPLTLSGHGFILIEVDYIGFGLTVPFSSHYLHVIRQVDKCRESHLSVRFIFWLVSKSILVCVFCGAVCPLGKGCEPHLTSEDWKRKWFCPSPIVKTFSSTVVYREFKNIISRMRSWLGTWVGTHCLDRTQSACSWFLLPCGWMEISRRSLGLSCPQPLRA